MNMLASDIANPAFVGAQNADDLLHVEFAMFEAIDGYGSIEASEEAQRPVVKKLPAVPYITIKSPGDNTSVIHVPVREEHKRRWPKQWLYFAMNEGLIEDKVDPFGWKIDDWDRFKDDKQLLTDLKYQRFNTVEQLAGMSDAQVQRLGMIGPSLRLDAQKAIRAKSDLAIHEKDREINQLKEQMAQMMEMMQKLTETPIPQGVPVTETQVEPPKKRKGRPPKVKTDG